MARARSPNSIEAEEMYKNGMKLVDIAKKFDAGNQPRIGMGMQKRKKTSARKRKKRALAIKVDNLETKML